MSNICSGVLKLRGTKEALLKFLKGEIKKNNSIYMTYNAATSQYESIEFDDDISAELSYIPYLKCNVCLIGLKNSCVLGFVSWPWRDEKEVYIQCLKIGQIERLEVEQFANIARKYNIDLRIKGYNPDKEFSQEFEIVEGHITKYEEQVYDDYTWEVDDPRMGVL